jgi:hypothetical protein
MSQVALIVVLPSVAERTRFPIEESELVKNTVAEREPGGMITGFGRLTCGLLELRVMRVLEVELALSVTIHHPL